MVEVLKTLETTLHGMSISKANHLQDSLCGLLQVIFIKVGPNIEKPLADNVIEIIVSLFT